VIVETRGVRILHLEDDPGDALLVRDALENDCLGCEIVNVSTRGQFEAALDSSVFDLVLSDYALPSFDGVSALAAVRRKQPDLPFVFVSGTMGEELAIEILKAGATDYVLKDRPGRLVSSVQRALAEARTRAERRQQERWEAMRHAVTRCLAESATMEEAAPLLLEAICDGGGYIAGALWFPDASEQSLSCRYFWHRGDVSIAEFEGLTRNTSFRPGVDMPGRVWLSGKPAWIPDIEGETQYLRGPVALRNGIRATCGVPIRSRSKALGVLDFYSSDIHPEDERLMAALGDIGNQLGQFVERRLAELALRESEERYRSVAEATNEWIWSAGPDGRTDYSNRAAEQMLGYTPEELVGKSLFDFFHPDDLSAARETFACGLASKSGWTAFPVRCRHKDGNYRQLESNAVPILGSAGEVLGFRGANRDVTDRLGLEAQLRQSQKMEAIGTLAGGIAHDFNNLLTTILGYSQMLLQALGPENPLSGEVEEIQKAGERAANLTRQLLAFSRKQILQPVVLDVNSIVRETEKMLRRLIGEDIDFTLSLDSEAGCVKADPGQVEQIIMNLAVNARDSMPRGGRLTIETRNWEVDGVRVRASAGLNPGSYVCLSIRDTGEGMDRETLSRIFEPFFTTKEHGKGTGLGLSTVYGIVKQSGGYITVDSDLGRGTSFEIYLPRVSEERPMAEGPRESAFRPGSETVLLVEDEAPVRRLAHRILEQGGYNVLQAGCAEEALRVFADYGAPIDLLVTDVVMPGVSGPELALRLVDSLPNLKVLFISGYTDHAAVRSGRLAPGQAFLQKPFDPELLSRKVRDMLDGKRDSREIPIMARDSSR
jgi:two-component system cell cycle sensor histidine kinase/response regulator CckA